MGDELVVTKPGDMIAAGGSKYATDGTLATVTTAGDYLPYIQLMGSSSDLVKQSKFPMGHFAMMKGKDVIDLGDNLDVVILGWRPKAMEFASDGLVVAYNPENPEFIRIRDAALNGKRGFAFGAEYLVYMPDFDVVACYLLGNKSGRLESPNMIACFDQQRETNEYVVVEVKSDLAKNKKGDTWHVPCVAPSESALTKMIQPDALAPILEKFNNPKESEVETVEDDGDTRAR